MECIVSTGSYEGTASAKVLRQVPPWCVGKDIMRPLSGWNRASEGKRGGGRRLRGGSHRAW